MADQSKKYKFDISNLNLHYGDFHALKDVNMQIEANKITAFIGPSGCGNPLYNGWKRADRRFTAL